MHLAVLTCEPLTWRKSRACPRSAASEASGHRHLFADLLRRVPPTMSNGMGPYLGYIMEQEQMAYAEEGRRRHTPYETKETDDVYLRTFNLQYQAGILRLA